MSTAGAQAAALVAPSCCWPERQVRPAFIRIISSCVARRSSNRSQLVTTVMWFSLVHLAGPVGPAAPEEHRSSEHYSLPSYAVHCIVNIVHGQTLEVR